MPYWRLFYHVVWGTKNRLDLIDPAWEKDLYGYMWGKATALECMPHAIGGVADHIHVVISIPPKLCVATWLANSKARVRIMSIKDIEAAHSYGRRSMEFSAFRKDPCQWSLRMSTTRRNIMQIKLCM